MPQTPHSAFQNLHAELSFRHPFLTSLLISQRGVLVHEQHTRGDAETAHDIQSVTKSMVSMLVGVALNQGHLAGVDVPVLDFFSDCHTLVQDQRWEKVTVRHLLNMTSGLPSELSSDAYDEAWYTAADPNRFALAQHLLEEPGTAFHYSNAGFHLLGEVLAKSTGQTLQDFARQVLFEPLGIRVSSWEEDAAGRVFGSGGIHLKAPFLHRVGQLVLQRGSWEGQQIIPASWIHQITRSQVRGYEWMEGLPWYGMGWWLTAELGQEAWYATGFGGQYLAVFPEIETVVSITGEVSMHPPHRQVIVEQILPVVLSGV